MVDLLSQETLLGCMIIQWFVGIVCMLRAATAHRPSWHTLWTGIVLVLTPAVYCATVLGYNLIFMLEEGPERFMTHYASEPVYLLFMGSISAAILLPIATASLAVYLLLTSHD